jgi:sortase (surface protein transpeptidase)
VTDRRRLSGFVPPLAAALLAAVGVGVLGADRPSPVAVPPSAFELPAVEPSATRPAPTWTVPSVAAPATAARPVRVRIPAIGVNSAIVKIGTDRAGVLVPPPTTDVTGWFTAGPVPGTVGPALLAGHVDSDAGPGVFFRLWSLRQGDRVFVDRADGSSVVFVVESTVRVAKTAFPTDLVYSPVPLPALRLITCGGDFDAGARSYRDNIIVEAVIR